MILNVIETKLQLTTEPLDVALFLDEIHEKQKLRTDFHASDPRR